MNDFFSVSRVPRWAKLLFVLSMLGMTVVSFFGVAFFTCSEPPVEGALIASVTSILILALVTSCSVEMEKWGRFKSNLKVWVLFTLAFVGSLFLASMQLYGIQTAINWNSQKESNQDFLEDVRISADSYEGLKLRFFELAESKLNQALNQSKYSSQPVPGVECRFGLDARTNWTNRLVSMKLAELKKEVRDGGDEYLSMIRSRCTELSILIEDGKMLKGCATQAELSALKKDLDGLKKACLEHIVMLDCPYMLTEGSENWVKNADDLLGHELEYQVHPLEIFKNSSPLALIITAISLVMVLLPIFLARPLAAAKSNSSTKI